MTVRELKKEMRNKTVVKYSLIEDNLSDSRLDALEKQLKGVTVSSDEDGDTVVPVRDVRKALNNPGKIV